MKNKRLRNWVSAVVFLLIVAFLFDKVTWVFRGNNSEPREDIVGFKNEENIDVVLYGGSNLLRYYQPLKAWNEKGYTSYNYATICQKSDLLKEYIKDSRLTNEATLYVCDIRTFPMVDESVDDPSIRSWSDSLPVFSAIRWQGITSYLFSRDWQEWNVSPFYFDIAKYHSNYDALKSEYQWSYVETKKIYNVDKGFAPYIEHAPLDAPEIIDRRGELTNQQENALNDLLDYCDSENLQVLFIVCPYYITESDWEILNTCGDIIQSRGYNFINFNHYYNEMGLDFETDFGDVNHVNYLGAEKYTEYLMNYIVDNYELSDYRGNEIYARWDQDYSTFSSMHGMWKASTEELVKKHLAAKKVGENIDYLADFYAWYPEIQNNNFTVIVKKNEYIDYNYEDEDFNDLISKYDIDMKQNNFIGVWDGKKLVYSTNEEETFVGKLGIDVGCGTVECFISSGDAAQIDIDGVDYYNEDAPVQIIVFDNNYQKVVDSIVLQFDNGAMSMVR